jgi:uncharacterized protein YbjT (DUF2867 family)
MRKEAVLVLGATGYVGNLLIPHLLESGHTVRASGRSERKLKELPIVDRHGLETAVTDVFDMDSLLRACEGCTTAYYLVHSMNPQQRDFMDADRKAAENMVWAAEKTGLERMIYLGGLGDEDSDLSKHLKSRAEVGSILQSSSVPLTYLRAAMIIGRGSASFEILRHLVKRLPIMITPRWVSTESQPIAIRNVLEYLSGCLENRETMDKTFDIGGPDILSYRHLMEIYAEEAGLRKRFVIPVPVLTPRLSSYWIHLVTPISASLAKPLAEGLKNRVICRNDRIKRFIPLNLLNCREAIRLAVQET